MQPEPMLTFPVWKARRFVPSESICFVLMPFRDDGVQEVYKRIIAPTLRRARLQPLRADRCHGHDIMEDIWAKLNEARLVVADLTGLNSNVLYEVGVAHCLGRPLILLKAGGSRGIPFDLNRFRLILYRRSEAGKKKLRRELREHVDALCRAHPPGDILVNCVESGAADWSKRCHDPAALASIEDLNHFRQYLPVACVSQRALAFCAASAAQYASVDNMIYWGRLVARAPDAAAELALGMRPMHPRPRLRAAHLVGQFEDGARARATAKMIEVELQSGLVGAVRTGTVPSYVERSHRRLDLKANERDTLLAEFADVRL